MRVLLAGATRVGLMTTEQTDPASAGDDGRAWRRPGVSIRRWTLVLCAGLTTLLLPVSLLQANGDREAPANIRMTEGHTGRFVIGDWSPRGDVGVSVTYPALVSKDGAHVAIWSLERSGRANSDFALAFYRNGKLVKQHPIRDLVEDWRFVPCLSSPTDPDPRGFYLFWWARQDPDWVDPRDTRFVRVTTFDQVTLVFDVVTGAIVKRTRADVAGLKETYCFSATGTPQSSTPSLAEWKDHPPSSRQLAQMLSDEKMADAAACRLIAQEVFRPRANATSAEARCVVNLVVPVKQEDGTVLHAVFMQPGFPASYAKPGLAKGVLYLFDADGHPVFARAELIDEKSDLVDYGAAGKKALVLVYPHGAGFMRLTYVLRVVPVDRSWRPTLVIAFGRPQAGDQECQFQWRMLDANRDGAPDLQIGLLHRGKFKAKATYLWKGDTKKFEGPKGGLRDGFLRLDNPGESCDSPEFKKWNAAAPR